MHNYHGAFRCFPAGAAVDTVKLVFDGRGTAVLVVLLPHLEATFLEDAYQPYFSTGLRWVDFAVEHPDLASLTISTYQCPSVSVWASFTSRKDYFGCTGGGLPNPPRHYRGRSYVDGVFHTNSFTKIGDITDGTSSTMAMGESVHPHRWGLGPGYGDPAGMIGGPTAWCDGGNIIPGLPLPAGNDNGRHLLHTFYPLNSSQLPMKDDFENDPPFGSQHPSGAQFVFCDGHVAFLMDTIDMGIYRALSTRATGEMIPADQIQ
jgi:prepilin-type processing-associated H-X9-DG protein